MKRIVLRAIDFSIRTLFKIKNKMTMSTQVQTENQIYVWTKTEKAGSIVVVAEKQKDSKWLYFEDGSRINPSLVNEYLMEAKTMDEAKMHASSFGNTLGITPTKTGPVEDHSNTVVTTTSDPIITQPKEEVKEEVNVMMEMLSKMSKKNKATMPVEVNIPSTMVYEMLQDQMDLEPSDLNEQIGMLVENQINNLQEQLREQIQSFISNYYNNEHREHTESE